jgi:hypothetical protein
MQSKEAIFAEIEEADLEGYLERLTHRRRYAILLAAGMRMISGRS